MALDAPQPWSTDSRGAAGAVFCEMQANLARPRLARAAGAFSVPGWVAEVSIKNIERGVTDPRSSTLDAIQKAFEKAGVVFLEPGDTRDGGPGLRLKKPTRRR
jgi:hypothetical protein